MANGLFVNVVPLDATGSKSSFPLRLVYTSGPIHLHIF